MKLQRHRSRRDMTGRPNQPRARAAPAAAIWVTVLLLSPGWARAQEAAPEPPSPEPATTATTQPSPSPATEQASTEPATTAPSETATRPATAPTPSSRFATSRPNAHNGPLALNFREASVQSVLEYLSEAAGLAIVEEARVEGRVTVMSLQPLSVDEAVSLLDTVLKAKGYAAVRVGRTLKIVTIEQAKKELLPVRSGSDPERIQPSDRMVTQIVPIRSVDAVRLRADLATLVPTTADVTANAASNTLIITGTEAVIRRITEIIRAIDVHMSQVSQVRVFQLKYANAANAARLITEIFREEQPTQQQAGGRGGFGGPRAFTMGGPFGPGGQQPAQGDQTGMRGVRVTASADERTNTLVVSAAPDVMTVIEGVVKDLDANPAETQAVFIFRLRNAQAKNLESVLNSIFGWTGTARPGTTAVRQTTGGGFGTAGTAFGTRTGGAGGRTGSTGGRGLSSAGGTGTSGTARTTGGGQVRTTGGFATGRQAPSAAAVAAGASDLAGQVYVVADEDTNSLLVTAASKNFERIKAIITDLDRAVPQVLIKVLIAEVTHDKTLDLGVEFSGMNLRASGKGFEAGTDFSVAAQTGGFMFRLDEKYVTAAIRAIAGVAKLDVLSRPYILTSDNQQASILVGQEVPFITRSQLTEAGQTINTIEYDDIGIILNVTPHINPQGLVTLDVYPEISTLTGETVPISETVNAPVFAKRYAQSRVAVRDGQTIVIGGLMEDRYTKSVDKVPLLGDIPILGLLFQRTIEKKTKTELLIFLTPHVAQQPEDLKEMAEAEKAGTKVVQDAVEKGTFQEHLEGMERGATSRPAAAEDFEPRIFLPEKEKTAPRSPDEPDTGEPDDPDAGDGSAPPPDAGADEGE